MTLHTSIAPRIDLPWCLRARLFLDRLMRLAAASCCQQSARNDSIELQFKRIIQQENATISKICFSYACSVAEFDDLRQDALINIWRGMSGFRGEASLKSWIYRVTVNSCLSTIRRQSKHKHDSLDQLYGLIENDASDKEAIEQMHRAISNLGAQEKAIIMMWLDELAYDEIAEAMGFNRNTIATKIRRIKEKIVKNFKEEEKK